MWLFDAMIGDASGRARSRGVRRGRRQAGSSSAAAMAEMLDGIDAAVAEHERWSQTAREREMAAARAGAPELLIEHREGRSADRNAL
jgi:hypothetical protein